MLSKRQQFKEAKENLESIIRDGFGYKFDSEIIDYQQKLYRAFNNYLELSIKRFPLIKKSYINWKMNNKGWESFPEYFKWDFTNNIQYSKKIPNIITGLAVGGTLNLTGGTTLGVLKVAGESNKYIDFALGVTAGLAAACFSGQYILRRLQIETYNELNDFTYMCDKFKNLDNELNFQINLAKDQYSDLSSEIKNGFTLETAEAELKKLSEELYKLDDERFNIDRHYEDLEEKLDELEQQITRVKEFKNLDAVVKHSEKLHKINEQYKANKQTLNKESEFYAEKE